MHFLNFKVPLKWNMGQMKMSDIISCFSKEKHFTEGIEDVYTSKESSLLKQVMMLEIFTSNCTGGLAHASNETIQRIYLCSWLARGKMSERKVILNFQNTTR